METNFDIIRDEVKIVIKTVLNDNSIELLEAKHKSFQRTGKDLKAPFDQAFRDVQLDLIEEETNVPLLQELVTLSIQACRKDILTLSLPASLLSDIFDLLTLDHCDQLFYYVEDRVNIWKEDLFFSSCKNILLRMCNDLLRKLSKSNATIFCGRILLFLAKFFPFSERSGLNIVSEFNLENVTEYGADEEIMDDIKEENGKDNEKGRIFIDYNLYCKFWSLQDFFRNPNQCYDKVQWKVFCSHATSIIATFEGLKLEHIDKYDPGNTSDGDEARPMYFSKYLTNQKLLDLQLYDVNFRRFVLLQFLILFQYLTSTVRFKSAELNGDQKTYIQSLAEKVHSLLRDTPPDGSKFNEIVTKIMVREENWNSWKNDGCPEFRKALPSSSAPLDQSSSRTLKPGLGEIIKEAQAKGTFYMGNNELTKLWNLYPDNLEACKAKDRDFLPQLDTYVNDALEHVRADELGQNSLYKDGNFGWRALRLLARRSLLFFTHTNKPISELHTFLELMLNRIANEKINSTQGNEEAAGFGNEEDDLYKQPMETPETDGEFHPNIILFRVTVLTVQQFHNICKALETEWQTLAKKLGYKMDEIDYIVAHHPEPFEQARNLLNLWFEEDDDSTLENFLYILEGLSLSQAAEEVKLAIEQNKNLTTDTSNN